MEEVLVSLGWYIMVLDREDTAAAAAVCATV
jgi:hypothetical protein